MSSIDIPHNTSQACDLAIIPVCSTPTHWALGGDDEPREGGWWRKSSYPGSFGSTIVNRPMNHKTLTEAIPIKKKKRLNLKWNVNIILKSSITRVKPNLCHSLLLPKDFDKLPLFWWMINEAKAGSQDWKNKNKTDEVIFIWYTKIHIFLKKPLVMLTNKRLGSFAYRELPK